MGACRVPDRGSIPRRGDFIFFADNVYLKVIYLLNIKITDISFKYQHTA